MVADLFSHPLDAAGLYRVVEGKDTIYSIIALEVSGFGNDIGINVIFRIPYSGQVFNKLLKPDEARKLASELVKFADFVENQHE